MFAKIKGKIIKVLGTTNTKRSKNLGNNLNFQMNMSVLLAILPSVVFAFLYYQSTTKEVENQLRKDLNRVVETANQDVEAHFSYLLRNLNDLTSLRIFSVAMDYQRFEGIQRFFDSVVSSDNNYAGVFFQDKNGRLVASSSPRDISRTRAEWLKLINRAAYTDQDDSFGIIKDENNQSMVIFKSAVKGDDGKVRGHLIGVYKSSFIAERFEKALIYLPEKVKEASQYFIFSRLKGAEILVFGSKEVGTKLNDVSKTNLSGFSLGSNYYSCSSHLRRLHSCIEIPESILVLDISLKEMTLLGVLMLSIFAFASLAIVLTRQIRCGFSSIVEKLDQLAKGDYALLKPTGHAYIDGYFEIANRTIEKMLEFQKSGEQAREYRAIARTTQMLAHDVRKPFTMLKMGIGLLKSATSENDVRKICTTLVPEVERAMVSVNGMIADVMTVGGKIQLNIVDFSPQVLVKAALLDFFQINRRTDLKIEYDFQNTNHVMADRSKILRVFANIVGNASDAMGRKGILSFSTRQTVVDGVEYCEFCIKNNGPEIPNVTIPKLFDAFYTEGKVKGTGLGLAISKKIMTAHEGEIWCSNTDSGVAFYFTLPLSKTLQKESNSRLPKNSKEAARLSAWNSLTPSSDKSEAQLEETILDHMERIDAPIRIGIIDDEAMYRQALLSLVESIADCNQKIIVQEFEGVDDLKALSEPTKFDLFICDLDLGHPTEDGFDLTADLRSKGFVGGICIHSNRCSSDDYRHSLEVGADAFFPKPMTRTHLLKIIATTLGSDSTALKS